MDNIDKNDLLELIHANQKRKNRRNYIFLSIAVFSAIIFIIYSSLSVAKTKTKTHQITIVKDSIENANKSYATEKKKEELIRDKIDIYLHDKYLIDSFNLSDLFTDTLKQYYLMTDVPISTVIQKAKKFIRRNPSQFFIYDRSSIALSISDNIGTTALVTATYCQNKNNCKEIIEEIRFTDSYKIYYVRAFNAEK